MQRDVETIGDLSSQVPVKVHFTVRTCGTCTKMKFGNVCVSVHHYITAPNTQRMIMN
jgi:hypothetical protein